MMKLERRSGVFMLTLWAIGVWWLMMTGKGGHDIRLNGVKYDWRMFLEVRSR